jgi:hypothetical protein
MKQINTVEIIPLSEAVLCRDCNERLTETKMVAKIYQEAK